MAKLVYNGNNLGGSSNSAPNVAYVNTELGSTNVANAFEKVIERTDDILGSDAYSSSTSYSVGDMCVYNNKLWKCLVACSGQTPSEGTYWTYISLSSIPILTVVNIPTTSFDSSNLLINNYVPAGKTPISFIITSGSLKSHTAQVWINLANGNKELVFKAWADGTTASSGTVGGILLCV